MSHPETTLKSGSPEPATNPESWRNRLLRLRQTPPPPRYSPREIREAWLEPWRSRPRAWVYAGVFLLLLGAFFWQAAVYWPATIDDAYISFRFSWMLAHGHGLRFNIVDDPVEGFTNFLWTVALAVPARLGLDVMYWAKLMGLASAAGIMAVACLFAGALRGRRDWLNLAPAAFLAFNAHFAHWAMMGLETQGAVLLVLLTYYRFCKETSDPRAWMVSPWIATLAAMMRIDALFFMSPLGVYGLALVLGARLPLRRMLAWAGIAAVTFGAYYGWKTWYFGDLMPNTYYAKQRLVDQENATAELMDLPTHARGKAHLREFYLNQNGADAMTPAALAEQGAGAWKRWMFTAGWYARGGPWNGAAWIAWWVGSLAILLALVNLRTFFLLLAPLGMNAYYVYHVNGDWMANFRFLQLSLPLLAMAGPVAIGQAQTLASRFAGRAVLTAVFVRSVKGFFILALFGLSLEQMRIESAYVWGPDDPLWFNRTAGWARGDRIRAYYEGGFKPALEEISNWLLLNTEDGATVFTSDFGLPMWMGTHLNQLDVEGLTDKHLAHAPSVRGDLPPWDEHLERILEERYIGGTTRSEMRTARAQATIREFEAHVERNVEYLLAEREPEYLILFIQNQTDTVSEAGLIYPMISERVHSDARRAEDYEVIARLPKAVRIYNWIYRRKDMAENEVSDRTKVERLREAIRRNPRLHGLVRTAWEAMTLMQDEGAKAEARRLVIESVARVARDADFVRSLAGEVERSGDAELAREIARAGGLEDR